MEHVAAHGISVEEFERIVMWPEGEGTRERSGRPMAFGTSDDGRIVVCVFEWIDDSTVEPVTAFFLED